MATLILRPTSGTGASWSDIGNAYDGNDSTTATVFVNFINYLDNTATFNFSIPPNVTINSAILTIRAKCDSSSNNIDVLVDINGDSNSRVIDQDLSSSATKYSADISNYINSLSTIKITAFTTSYSTRVKLSLYEIYITVDYKVNNIYIGSSNLSNATIGLTTISKVYIGDTLTYISSGSSEEKTNILPKFSKWTNELVNGTISGV